MKTHRSFVSKCQTHQTKLVPGQLCEGCLEDELKANAPEFLLSQCDHEASGCDCGAPIHGGQWIEQWGLACKSCIRQALALAREEGRREGLEEAAKNIRSEFACDKKCDHVVCVNARLASDMLNEEAARDR